MQGTTKQTSPVWAGKGMMRGMESDIRNIKWHRENE